jgi:hypothetical protein
MIDEQKIIGMLQAKALGCLDDNENKELQEFVDAGHLFPWDELGEFQNVASLLPLALELELPDAELKDRVALKLIKLSEQLRASKILEEDKFEIEEEVDEALNDFTNIEEPFVEPPIEIESEAATVVEDNLVTALNQDEITFNLDEVKLPGFEESEVSENNLQEETTFESPIETLVDESQIEYPKVEEVEINEVLTEPEVPVTDVKKPFLSPEQTEIKPAEVPEDTSNQVDFNKRSVAEKMFKAIEQDFDSLKHNYEESERKITRGLLISYIVIAILLAIIIFSFFKFSSDIKVLENEIKDLKQKTSSMYEDQKTNFDHHFRS